MLSVQRSLKDRAGLCSDMMHLMEVVEYDSGVKLLIAENE